MDVDRFSIRLPESLGLVIEALSWRIFNGSERMVRHSGIEKRPTHRLQWGIVDNGRKLDPGDRKVDDGENCKNL